MSMINYSVSLAVQCSKTYISWRSIFRQSENLKHHIWLYDQKFYTAQRMCDKPKNIYLFHNKKFFGDNWKWLWLCLALHHNLVLKSFFSFWRHILAN